MKKFIVAFIFLLVGTGYAQQALQEVVYLKNGSIIRGTIIEQVPNKSISIQTVDGSVFVYTMDQVEKITKEPPFKNKNNLLTGNDDDEKSSGYAGYFKFGVAFVGGEFPTNMISANIINGFKVSKQISIGLGLGIESIYNLFLIPIYFSGHTSFLDGDVHPYIYGNLGYSIVATSNFNEVAGAGIVLGFGVGVKFSVSPGLGITLDAGYRMQGTGNANLSAFALCY